MELAQARAVSEYQRMALNGETPFLIAFLRELKTKNGGKTDTSVPEPWASNCKWLVADAYAVLVTSVQVPKIVLFAPLFLVLFLPVCVWAGCIASSLPSPTERIPKSLSLTVGFVSLAPAVPFVCLSLLLDSLLFYLFGLVYCALTFGWLRFFRGQAILAPLRDGPPLWYYLGDYLVALVGQAHRRGPISLAIGHALGLVLIPWLKYFLHTNAFLYELEYRFVNQIASEPLESDEVKGVQGWLRICTRCKFTEDQMARTHNWSFMAHHPEPPPQRRWALGLHTVRQPGVLGCLTLPTASLCHCVVATSTNGQSTEQLVVSNSAVAPVYRVPLWYNNPFHPVTAYVEANVQRSADGRLRLEHPMWIVSSRSPLVSSSLFEVFGVGFVDKFLGTSYLPNIRKEIADDAIPKAF